MLAKDVQVMLVFLYFPLSKEFCDFSRLLSTIGLSTLSAHYLSPLQPIARTCSVRNWNLTPKYLITHLVMRTLSVVVFETHRVIPGSWQSSMTGWLDGWFKSRLQTHPAPWSGWGWKVSQNYGLGKSWKSTNNKYPLTYRELTDERVTWSLFINWGALTGSTNAMTSLPGYCWLLSAIRSDSNEFPFSRFLAPWATPLSILQKIGLYSSSWTENRPATFHPTTSIRISRRQHVDWIPLPSWCPWEYGSGPFTWITAKTSYAYKQLHSQKFSASRACTVWTRPLLWESRPGCASTALVSHRS